MSDTFHTIADQLDAIAQTVRDLGDQVHLGTYTVGEPPPDETTPSETTSASKTTKSSS